MIFDPTCPKLMKNPSKEELEDFFILCICVAGKKASVQRQKVSAFLMDRAGLSPFEYLSELKDSKVLGKRLREIKIGQYKRIEKSLSWLASNPLNLETCSIQQLEEVPGIGPKTSRFFVLYSRGTPVGVLDRHIMRWLKEIGYADAPSLTPPRHSYPKWEKVFLEEATKRNMNALDLDAKVWLDKSGY